MTTLQPVTITFLNTLQDLLTIGLPVDTALLEAGSQVSEAIATAADQDGFIHGEMVHLYHGRLVAVPAHAFLDY